MKITTLILALSLSITAFTQGNGYLGISMQKSSKQGVRISEVLENGAAQTHKLLQNDVILRVDGIDVNTAKELKDQITSHNWGETIAILFIRNGKTLSKNVTLGNKAQKVTYHVKRKKVNASYVWNFDESTWITMTNGKAEKMVKLLPNGSKSSLTIKDGADTPQEFSDLDDKLEIIEAIDLRNAGKRFYPSITVYIKTYTEPTKVPVVPTKPNSELSVYPNPSLGEFNFNFKVDKSTDNEVSWQVIDITGKLIVEGQLNDFEGATTQKLIVTDQGAGVYLLRVVNNNEVYTERLVVN